MFDARWQDNNMNSDKEIATLCERSPYTEWKIYEDPRCTIKVREGYTRSTCNVREDIKRRS
jgi:hypothetical protein